MQNNAVAFGDAGAPSDCGPTTFISLEQRMVQETRQQMEQQTLLLNRKTLNTKGKLTK
ncbi:hypothetical protein T3H00_27570 [Pseudomonas fluorescens]|jgi:hypothetical protein|uniref:hypothetical protein n=1 Tax=Pseudomonas fluorescens TaxID=294 RepID=UPI002ACA5326|nr:hypothetical protein [Pseudomonas fluorescens]MDZ5436412.1 hypothetical protein [Pseudomonas fluorescens]